MRQERVHGFIEPILPVEFVRNALSEIFRLTDFRILGRNNIPNLTQEPVFFAFGPHCGHLDSLVVRRAIPIQYRNLLVYPAASTAWDKPNARLMALAALNPISMARDGNGPKAIRDSMEKINTLINQGYSIVISPEGTRTYGDLPLQERHFKEGIAELINRTNGQFPVIPVRLIGLENILDKNGVLYIKFPIRHNRISVIFGEPKYYQPHRNTSGPGAYKARREWGANLLEDIRIQLNKLGRTSSG